MTCTICDQTFDETTMCLVKYNPGDSERMGYFTAHLECSNCRSIHNRMIDPSVRPTTHREDLIIGLVLDELHRTETKFPVWPKDPVHRAAIVAEEAGELVRASINRYYCSDDELSMDKSIIEESIQTAATSLRLLFNMSRGY